MTHLHLLVFVAATEESGGWTPVIVVLGVLMVVVGIIQAVVVSGLKKVAKARGFEYVGDAPREITDELTEFDIIPESSWYYFREYMMTRDFGAWSVRILEHSARETEKLEEGLFASRTVVLFTIPGFDLPHVVVVPKGRWEKFKEFLTHAEQNPELPEDFTSEYRIHAETAEDVHAALPDPVVRYLVEHGGMSLETRGSSIILCTGDRHLKAKTAGKAFDAAEELPRRYGLEASSPATVGSFTEEKGGAS